MLKLIDTLRAKPSDRTIRLVRTGFAIILLFVITFGIAKTHWNYGSIPQSLIYILYFFPLVGLVRGIFDPGIFRKKIWKWTVFGLGITMMIISLFLIETDIDQPIQRKIVVQSTSGEISAGQFAAWAVYQESGVISIPSVDTDFWIGFFGFWVAIFGFALTSKNITKKNERFGEKVTKIRV